MDNNDATQAYEDFSAGIIDKKAEYVLVEFEGERYVLGKERMEFVFGDGKVDIKKSLNSSTLIFISSIIDSELSSVVGCGTSLAFGDLDFKEEVGFRASLS